MIDKWEHEEGKWIKEKQELLVRIKDICASVKS